MRFGPRMYVLFGTQEGTLNVLTPLVCVARSSSAGLEWPKGVLHCSQGVPAVCQRVQAQIFLEFQARKRVVCSEVHCIERRREACPCQPLTDIRRKLQPASIEVSIMSRQHYSSERLYVGNLPYDVTEREVDDLFYKFGRIRDIEVKRSRKNDTSFAFVVFDDKYSVDDAIERRDGMRYGDMCLRVERGGERRGGRGGGDGGSYGPPRRSAFRVRVHGLPPTASWQDLKDHMRKAGDVGFASVENRIFGAELFLSSNKKSHKRFCNGCIRRTLQVGIVEYPTREEMEYAIKRLDRSEFCNIFHRAQIRVERDYGSAGEEEYERVGRRSRSYSERRNRSRSPRRESSHAEHESSSRRQRDCAGSREASRANAHSDIEQCPSVRSDKVGTTDSRETHESHTRPNSRSGSNSRGGSCATEVHGRGDSQVGEQKRTSEPAGRLRSSSGSPPSRHTDESHPVSAIEA